MKKQKLFIPSITISHIPESELGEYFTQPDFEKGIFEVVFHSIKHYSKFKGAKSAELFEIKELDKIVSIPRSEWKTSLSASMSYFEKKQDYERCAECKSLIDKI